ncbi:TM2 domain-containing membrane protein YozV [Paenibacillus lactis]|uniref:TM2 domain-containing membrane protein YozV n=1 Tax=Paenibacillus lactis TaxID=228574 RepID=A0ABS4FGQ1_9BACL|nr:TM2 domain-containing membrane protein YozV [Paenibacillus lactis]
MKAKITAALILNVCIGFIWYYFSGFIVHLINRGNNGLFNILLWVVSLMLFFGIHRLTISKMNTNHTPKQSNLLSAVSSISFLSTVLLIYIFL